MICFLIEATGTGAEGRALATLAGRLGFEVIPLPDLEALAADARFARAERALVLVPDAQGGARAPDAVRLAREEGGRAFVVYVAASLAPELYKQLVRTGAGEWVGWETCAEELREIAGRLVAPPAARRGARIVSVLPSKGGVGNTFLALEAAVHLASRRRRTGGRVAVLDLNLGGGTLADALDAEPRFEVGEILERPERLDEQLIDVFTTRHSPRLDVFAPPPRPLRLEDGAQDVLFALLDAIAARYDALLIDLPRLWAPWVDTLAQGSDLVVVTGAAGVPGLRRLGATLAHLDGLGVAPGRLAVAVNLCDADLFGRVRRRREIERALAGRRLFLVRRDLGAVGGALDAGRPLLEAHPGARVAADVKRLAEWIAAGAGPDAAVGPATGPAMDRLS